MQDFLSVHGLTIISPIDVRAMIINIIVNLYAGLAGLQQVHLLCSVVPFLASCVLGCRPLSAQSFVDHACFHSALRSQHSKLTLTHLLAFQQSTFLKLCKMTPKSKL